MAVIADTYIKKETLETILKVLETKGEKGISITISLNDETKHHELKDGRVISNNVWAYVTQSKEDREAKKDRFTVGNGKVRWMNEVGAVLCEKYEDLNQEGHNNNIGTSGHEPEDLPF